MDTIVIQEIANQLGMEVDQASQFITEQLLNYAALQILRGISSISLCIAILLASSIVLYLSLMSLLKATHAEKDFIDMVIPLTLSIVFAIAVLAELIVLVILLSNIPNIIGWINYPESMLIDKALHAIK